MNAIKQALDDSAQYTGVTIHYVDEGMDSGAIIKQNIIKINDNDTSGSDANTAAFVGTKITGGTSGITALVEDFNPNTLNFETIERPIYKKLNNSISAKTKKIVSNIKNNTLIIGASSGLGNEILKIYSHNKKIKIYASYYRNNINIKKKNIYIFKLNVLNDILSIINLIKEYQDRVNDKNLVIHLNASDERGIDTIRNQISSFVNEPLNN